MSRLSKTFKKYERHILLGVVVILLVSFSVTGAIQCAGPSGDTKDFGGTFQATPNKSVSLDNAEVIGTLNRYDGFRRTVQGPTLRYQHVMFGLGGQRPSSLEAAWAHLIASQAAAESGYEVGEEYQLKLAVRNAVAGPTRGLAFSDALYEQFLREYYHGSSRDFQQTVREVAAKDMFLEPIIDSQRYGVTYEEAYEAWKKETEYIDLEFVALRGRDFELKARELEKTRSAIQDVLEDLARVDMTARTLKRLEARIDAWRRDNEDKLPEGLDALSGITAESLPKDAWDQVVRFAAAGEDYTLTSDGPDGEAGTADDVMRAVAAELESLAALARASDGLQRWHKATGAWPEALASLLEAPTPKEPNQPRPLPPLTREPKDGHGQALHFAGGDAAKLVAVGPDGELGTADDIAAELDGETWRVRAGPNMRAFVDDDVADAWGKNLRVRMRDATTRMWDVRSSGPDGMFDTEDDVFTGNDASLRAFYRQPEVQSDYMEPVKRRFQAIYLHLPLVPDEIMAKLWEAFPQHRPDEKADALDTWRQLKEPGYAYDAEEPDDAEKGYGAELARRLAPNKPAALVPDPKIFGDAPADLMEADDPDREAYLEKGWREVLLRELFLEKLMNDLLTQARDAHAAHEDWTKKKAAFDKGEGEGEDPGEEPALVTFESLLAGPLAPYLPGEADAPYLGFYETEKPMTLQEWEAEENLGDINLTLNGLNQLSEPGQFSQIPVVLHDNLTKAILRNVEFISERQPELDEVRDQVFERYITKRGLDLAAEALDRLRDKAQEAKTGSPSEDGADAPDEGALWHETVAAWGKDVGVPHVLETTGWFMGPRPPRQIDPDPTLQAADAERMRRRQFVQQTGYESVRALAGSSADGTRPGTFGRSILRDDSEDGTNSAFLVRVVDKRYPEPEAFSANAYSYHVMTEFLGDLMSRYRSDKNAVPRGLLPQALNRYYRDTKWLANQTDLKTAVDPNKPRE